LLQWQAKTLYPKTSLTANFASKNSHCLFANTIAYSVAEAVAATAAMKNCQNLNKKSLSHSSVMINLFRSLHHF
jgi:hypothetical protein